MFVPLGVDDNTKKFSMACLLYWMVVNDNSFLQEWKVLSMKSTKLIFSENLFTLHLLYVSSSSPLIFFFKVYRIRAITNEICVICKQNGHR